MLNTSTLCSAIAFYLCTPLTFTTPFSLTPGHVYATDTNRRDITEFDPQGQIIATWAVPGYTRGLKGITFDLSGNLLVVAVTASGYDVLTYNRQLQLANTYAGPQYVAGNLSSGKLTIAADNSVYVAGQNSLRKFTPSNPQGTTIFSGNQVFDVDLLDNGDLIVATAYDLFEITPTGTFVREIASNLTLIDLRGIAYHAQSKKLYATMLGYTNNYFQLMKIDPNTGAIEQSTTFGYADDISLTADSQLLVGSRTTAPSFFSVDLSPAASLSEQRMFVAVMPEPERYVANGFE